MIRFDHVSKSYKGTPRPALDDITTEILRGEFVFVVGASGSGKSTFLRLILREERATRGKLHVLGQNLSSISNRKVPYFRRNVGVVFQDFRLLTNKTVFDNVAFTLQVIGKSKGFVHEAVPDVLAMVGLEGKGQRFPHELSGGEQQRVAIARAVVNKPQILLADEPTGNLDPATSAGITAVLERINASGTTVLMATHEAGLVDRMQKRVIELVGGKLIRDERHGGYGFTAAIPVLDEHGRAEVPRAYGAEDEPAQQPGAAASATLVSARAAKPSRADRKAEKIDYSSSLRYDSAIDAVSKGTQDGMMVATNIAAILIVMVALVALFNMILGAFPHVGGQPLTIERILGTIFTPLAWLIGIPWKEAATGGWILGVKMVLTEFVAFLRLATIPVADMTERTRIILTYATCGFANIGSVGISVAGFSALMPSRRKEILGLVWKALLSGFLATCLSAAIVGALPNAVYGL